MGWEGRLFIEISHAMGLEEPLEERRDGQVVTHGQGFGEPEPIRPEGEGLLAQQRPGRPAAVRADAAHPLDAGASWDHRAREEAFQRCGRSKNSMDRLRDEGWLGDLDSNQDSRSQSPMFYR